MTHSSLALFRQTQPAYMSNMIMWSLGWQVATKGSHLYPSTFQSPLFKVQVICPCFVSALPFLLFLISHSAQPHGSVLIIQVQLELAFQFFLTWRRWKSRAASCSFSSPLCLPHGMSATFPSLRQHLAMQHNRVRGSRGGESCDATNATRPGDVCTRSVMYTSESECQERTEWICDGALRYEGVGRNPGRTKERKRANLWRGLGVAERAKTFLLCLSFGSAVQEKIKVETLLLKLGRCRRSSSSNMHTLIWHILP